MCCGKPENKASLRKIDIGCESWFFINGNQMHRHILVSHSSKRKHRKVTREKMNEPFNLFLET